MLNCSKSIWWKLTTWKQCSANDLKWPNDSNDKWQMTCHFNAQMTNDFGHLNVILPNIIIFAYTTFIYFFNYNHIIIYVINISQSNSNDWNDQMTNDYE